MKGRISKKERARRQLRWKNRRRKLHGLPPLLDPRKSKARARRKKKKRRERGSGLRRRVSRKDGRRKWVRERKKAGQWLPDEEYAKREAEFIRLHAEALDKSSATSMAYMPHQGGKINNRINDLEDVALDKKKAPAASSDQKGKTLTVGGRPTLSLKPRSEVEARAARERLPRTKI